MVWSGYAVLMSGKTDSITKLNNNPGCLPGSTFVYSEVFKLDFSSASPYSEIILFPFLHLLCEYPAWFRIISMNYGAELTARL
ncbi:hypothetical protein Tco_1244633 [Tanacetum coccineum]